MSGTTLESRDLNGEIDAAYEEALRTDRKLQALTERMINHQERILEEPSLIDPHVTINVRHTTIGLKVRIFNEDALFREVYVWVASLAMEPEWFHLVESFGNVLIPSKKVLSTCLNVLPCTSMNECNGEVLQVLENSQGLKLGGLMGTSLERKEINDEIDAAYEESLHTEYLKNPL